MVSSTLSPKRAPSPAKAARQSPPENQNIWQNERGTWQLHCSFSPTRAITEKIQLSLSTQSVEVARARRDALFGWLQACGVLNQRTSRQRPVWVAAPEAQPWLEDVRRSKFPSVASLPVLNTGQVKPRSKSKT